MDHGQLIDGIDVRPAPCGGSGNGTGPLGASVDPHGPLPHAPGDGGPWLDTWFCTNPVFVDVVRA